MSAFVYVIATEAPENPRAGRRTYVGWTVDLEQRLARHNAGRGAKSTRGKSWVLLYAERFENRRDAMSREWHLKKDRAFRATISRAA